LSDTYSFYNQRIVPNESDTPIIRVVETDIDLYYHIAFEMYTAIERNNRDNKPSVFIAPVGPTFQYRRFAWLCRQRPIDLSQLHVFFMDEYLDEGGHLIDPADPLSFRGFVRRELVDLLDDITTFNPEQINFPDPDDPGTYDARLGSLGGAQFCFAGVGINGHLAFNEPPSQEDPTFRDAPSRVITLSRETITINSNTALGGAWEQIPRQAVTVGMKQILESRRIMIYLNRPWQRAVARKLLFGPVTSLFPASLVREHEDVVVTMTESVAVPPDFGLR
jgi:glucosamine-6-phosphate deaminase